MNLIELLRRQVARRPTEWAFVDCDQAQVCSYASLAERIGDSGARLAAVGVSPGSLVGLHCASGLEYIVTAYGLWSAGATVVPIAPELTPDEKRDLVTSLELDGVVTMTSNGESFLDGAGDHQMAEIDECRFVSLRSGRSRPTGFVPKDTAFIRFTSGTTGAAKGVILSHATVIERIHAVNEGIGVGPSDRVLALLSMSYHFVASIVGYLSFGATVLHTRSPFGDRLVDVASSWHASVIFAAPQHYRSLGADLSDRPLPELRLAVSTTTRCSEETAERFYRRFGVPVAEAYGIIEVGIPCVNLDGWPRKAGSVGRPLPPYRVRVQGGERGGIGPVEIAGRGLFDGYYQPWVPREEALARGWFATGDLGRIDDEGYLYIVGRTHDVINVGGLKVFPDEVERVLERHPAIAEACVSSRPHGRLGEVPTAKVVFRSGARVSVHDLEVHCRQYLSPGKVPVMFCQVDDLPKTASGKLIRRPNNQRFA